MPATARWDRGVADVAATLRTARERDKGCALLIGAGCSVTAGIPAASGIVALIREKYQLDYDRAPQKTYAACMAEISAGERRDLIVKYVDAAKVNWAHICIAQLMKEGYIDRILTTNFDPLVIRACALVGHFPAVYDFASSQLFDPENLPRDAVVYLHGQRTGFVLLNTEVEVKKHATLLKPVFDEAGQNRVWIVAGYSGENDPVFDRLVEFDQFDNRLYWIGYGDGEPAQHVSEALLEAGKDAFFVRGMDSDAFFLHLATELEVFPPDFIGRPFSYLESLMETLAASDTIQPGRKSPSDNADGARDTAQTGRKNSRDYMERARRMIRDAVDHYEGTDEAEAERVAEDLLISGRSDEVMKLTSEEPAPDTEMASQKAWAHVTEGNKLGDDAIAKSGPDADSLFRAAYENYAAALALQPEMHDALNNWGLTLADQAGMKSGADADELFDAAYEKFEAAVSLAPDDPQKLGNWANTLASQARQKEGADAEALFDAASEKYDRSLRIAPDDADHLNNYAVAVGEQAKQKSAEEAAPLYVKAYELYERAVAARPESAQNLRNWALTLVQEARDREEHAADTLFASAYEKFAAAHELDSADAAVLSSWGATLFQQAERKEGDEAADLFTQAFDRYEQAYALNQQNSTLVDTAVMLRGKAKWARGDDVARLFEDVLHRLRTAERREPGSAAYNLACLAAIQGKRRDARRWLEKCKALGTLPPKDDLESDTDLDSLRDHDWFKALLVDA